ncbi:nuclear factor erythroid 2-related factor 3 [Brachyhypopomus gauderio]|uniref:nuclear factor erythroid 2-related factor 3 n=1 Tax=Brachyhypopomus gauderio TaxID=698409 RepID=UPI004040FC0C
MKYVKKYFTEGLIQFTILLSLIGVRVDVDSYLNGYFSPLIETDGGPSSAFIQTPFHRYRDTAAGQQVHPKCPELDYYFTSRRLLNEVRALGSPARFPTRLSAWLLHLVPDGSELDGAEQNNGIPGTDELNQEHLGNEADSIPEAASDQAEEEIVKDEDEEISLDSLNQLSHSSALEQEGLFSVSALPPPLSDPRWQDLLADFDDFNSLAPQHMSDLDVNLANPISYNASLQDAMVTNGVDYRPDPPRGQAQTTPHSGASMFRIESTNSSHSDTPPAAAGLLASPLFSLPGNSSHNDSSHSGVGGYLDEAVFEHISLLGLEGLSVDPELLNRMEGGVDLAWLEDVDSDSGLSLESRSRSPASTSASSSDSFCEDEGGATGYSSEVESITNKRGVCASAYYHWSPVDFSENIWHDHTYSVHLPEDHSPHSLVPPLKGIKEEVMSEDESGTEELSRDERRLQALGFPFSAPQIVNMPVEDFLELLEGRGLSVSEVTLLRDVRRRGKNKLAAQNCRKRKLDAILGLQAEVGGLLAQRDALLRERAQTAKALSAAAAGLDTLSRDVLRRIRDERGRPLSTQEYAIHYSANGRVMVRPRPTRTHSTEAKNAKRKKDKKP